MSITVIKEFEPEKFSRTINKLLSEGWELFGEPKIETVVELNTWDGTQYSRSHTVYHQILKTSKK